MLHLYVLTAEELLGDVQRKGSDSHEALMQMLGDVITSALTEDVQAPYTHREPSFNMATFIIDRDLSDMFCPTDVMNIGSNDGR